MSISLIVFIVLIVTQVNILIGSDMQALQIASFVLRIISLAFILYILLSNREYGVKWAWLLFIGFLPFLGMFSFYIFGRNSREVIKLRQKYQAATKLREEWSHLVQPKYSLDELQINDAAHIAKHALYARTKIDILEANEPFDAIFKSVSEAQHHIHFEFYMMHEEELTSPIIDVLCDKAQQGVEVRVLLDYVGTLMSFLQSQTVKKMLAAGVEVEFYNKTFSLLFDSTVLYRNHRKIVIVDGVEGFTGGYNFDGKYGNKKGVKPYWRDLHMKLTGDAVHQLQNIFLIDWYATTKQNVIKKNELRYFPDTTIQEGPGVVQIVADGYDTNHTAINDTYFRLITKAKYSVDIATPYFVPTPELLMALKMAARTGVRVRILLPGVPDKKSVYAASRSFISELLNSGVEVYLMNETFVHQKLIVIDGQSAALGTSNFDLRSIHTNLELMVFIYQHEEIQHIMNLFAEDIERSTNISLEAWTKRPLMSKMHERFFKLFSALF